ncbi:MAG: hypothetical protein WAN36_07315 [Calditrichia bacterium]
MQEKLTEVDYLIDKIYNFTMEAVNALQENAINEFTGWLQKRDTALKELAGLREKVNKNEESFIPQNFKNALNKAIQSKFENIIKVDQKIFDIMKEKKANLSGKIQQANKGKSFLDQYRKQVNSANERYRTL